MVEFHRKSAIKLLKLTQFTSPTLSIYLILYGVGVRCDVDIFQLTAVHSPFIEMSMPRA